MPGANILAYLASSLARKKKSFITLTLGVDVTNISSLSLTLKTDKLEGLSSQSLHGLAYLYYLILYYIERRNIHDFDFVCERYKTFSFVTDGQDR